MVVCMCFMIGLICVLFMVYDFVDLYGVVCVVV